MEKELFTNRKEQREVTETMGSLLTPLINHCDEKTKSAIQKTLRILRTVEIESEV